MKLQETEIVVPAPDCEILTTVISPVGGGPWPGVLLYTDIFQRTESTLRTARRLASAGFIVFVPDIYPRGELAGVALEFDDPGKQSGLAGRRRRRRRSSTPTASAVLDAMAQRARRRRALRRSGSASAVTWRSARPSTHGSQRRSASTRPDCTTERSVRTPTPGRSPRPRPSRAG